MRMRTETNDSSVSLLTRQQRAAAQEPASLGRYDAVVVGGGIGGCAAAAKLGAQGVRVALLEPSGVLGWEIVRARQLHLNLSAMSEISSGAGQLHESIVARSGLHNGMLDPVATALALDHWLTSAHVDICFHTWPSRLAMTEDNVITGMIAACKSGYVSLESGCIIDTTWEAKLSKSVFAPQPNGRHASSSYVMLWNETDVSKPMSFQIELTSGLSCRVAIRPTFWPKEAHAFITFTENNANPSISAVDLDVMTLSLFELVEKLKLAVPELAEGLVSYVSDRSWQPPPFHLQTGVPALSAGSSQAGCILAAEQPETGSLIVEPVLFSELTNPAKAEGLFLGGPWLTEHPVDTESQSAVSQLFMLGEAAAHAALSLRREHGANTRRNTHVHQS